jgi:hypothetical protein
MPDDYGFQQGDLFAGDPTANRHGGNPESTAAHASIADHKARILRQVIDYVTGRGAGGATCDEIEQALAMSHQTASARCTEAVARGLLVRSEVRRLTRSGRKAAVLVAPVSA